jgi:uncharacterized membrane protein (UPF0127 family)
LTVTVARGFIQRTRGLAWSKSLPAGDALQINRCRSIHTFGMRFRLDLLWLDQQGRAIRVDYDVPPRRLRSCSQACAVVEVTAGEGRDLLESGYTAAR